MPGYSFKSSGTLFVSLQHIFAKNFKQVGAFFSTILTNLIIPVNFFYLKEKEKYVYNETNKKKRREN